MLHRVFANSNKSRISVASFHSLPYEYAVQPSKKLTSETNPMRYKGTDYVTFLNNIKSCEYKEKNFLESRKLT